MCGKQCAMQSQALCSALESKLVPSNILSGLHTELKAIAFADAMAQGRARQPKAFKCASTSNARRLQCSRIASNAGCMMTRIYLALQLHRGSCYSDVRGSARDIITTTCIATKSRPTAHLIAYYSERSCMLSAILAIHVRQSTSNVI